MRFWILGMMLLPLLGAFPAAAQTYSCRDSQGQLHFADSPARLPAECLGKERQIEQGKVDSINIVPAQPTPQGSGREFEQSVRAAEQELRQKQQRIESLYQKARELSSSYQGAVRSKNDAMRSWSYGSRDKVKAADEQMANARNGKKELLQKLEAERIPSDDQQKIRKILEGVEEG